MRGEDDLGGRHLVDVAHLEAHDPVLDVVDDARRRCAPPTSATRRMSSTRPSSSPSRLDRQPVAEADAISSRPSGARWGGVTSWKTSSGGGWSRSSMAPPSLERPQRLSSIEYGRASMPPDRDAVLLRVGDLLVAAHLPLAHRRDDLQVRRRASRRSPRCAPGRSPCRCTRGRSCRRRARGPRHGELGQERPAERGEQRVPALVAARSPGSPGRRSRARTPPWRRRPGSRRAQVEGLLAHGVEVVVRLAQVDAERHHLGVVLVLDPLEHHRRVQAARVEQHHAVHLVGQCEVARHGRCGAMLGQRRSSGRIGAGESSGGAVAAPGRATRARGGRSTGELDVRG